MRMCGGAGGKGKREKEEGREEPGRKKGHPCCVNQTPVAPHYCEQSGSSGSATCHVLQLIKSRYVPSSLPCSLWPLRSLGTCSVSKFDS